MRALSAQLVGDLIALTRTSAPAAQREAQIADVLADHGYRAADLPPAGRAALATELDSIARQAITLVAAVLGVPAAEQTRAALNAADPGPDVTRVYWVREDGRDEQRWVVDAPTTMLRDVADGRVAMRVLDEWVTANGVLLTPTTLELDEDEAAGRRTDAQFGASVDEFDFPECWPEATTPQPLLD